MTTTPSPSVEALTLLKMILRGIEQGKVPDQTIIRRGDADEIEMEPLSTRIRNVVARYEQVGVVGQ